MIVSNIWLIGTGYMAIEYAKVLNALKCDYVVIGRGEENCNKFFAETKVAPKLGGLENFIKTNPTLPNVVINAVGIEALTESTQQLINYGVKNILLEKPGFGYPQELQATLELASKYGVKILLAYNRRFYQSVIKAKEVIDIDGGVESFNFEFTEWSHSVGTLQKHKAEHENWFYGNSSHLIDLAFYLGGKPIEMCNYKKGSLPWHPSGSVFAGAGITDSNALFSYIANWESPGRWNLEVCTKKHRLIFKPVEKLQIMKIGSVAIDFVEGIDYSFDEMYKPGLYLQTKAYLSGDETNFVTIEDIQQNIADFYSKINS
jgi:predicted dehydrogenase